MSDTHIKPSEDVSSGELVPLTRRDASYESEDQGQVVLNNNMGFFARVIRDQPIVMLSAAFGLGLIATTLLARRTT